MNRRAAAGFTLLEILVVLAVFGFLLVGLNQTVRFGLTAWRQQARLSDGKTDLEAVDRSLRSIIENLATGQNGEPPIDGTADRLTGVTMLRVPGEREPARIEAGLALSGQRLVLRWRPYHRGVALQAPPVPQETTLMSGLSRLVVAYWRPSGGWVSRWSAPDLPPLVRIHLVFAEPNAVHWPDIVVAPALSRP